MGDAVATVHDSRAAARDRPANTAPVPAGPTDDDLLALQRGLGNGYLARAAADVGAKRSPPGAGTERIWSPPASTSAAGTAGTAMPPPAGGPTADADQHEREADLAAGAAAALLPPHVRVHDDAAAARAAAALHAEAFTVGDHIYLGADHPQLDSSAGRRLIAHELVHVRQQAVGAAPRGVPQCKRRVRPARGTPFRVVVDHEMGSDELMREFVAQYHRATAPQEIARLVTLWRFTGRPPTVGPDDVARGYKVLRVTDVAKAEFERQDAATQREINAETDRRFWAEKNLAPGTILGSGPEDAELAARWRGVRANLMAEQAQARALLALPEDIKKILFAGGREIHPDEYQLALELADRLGRLSPAERARYLATVNAGSDDLADLATSIERFERERRMREFDAARTDEAAKSLFGMEELYDLYRARGKAERMAVWGPALQGMAVASAPPGALPSGRFEFDYLEHREVARQRFREALARSHFATEADFLTAVQRYQHAFRTEAVNLAMDVLAGYDHLLYVARIKYRDTDAADRLVAAIAASGAAGDYREAEEEEARADLASQHVADDLAPGRGPQLLPGNPFEMRARARELRASGERKVVAGSGNDPLVDPAVLGRGTDRRMLATASAEAVRAHLLGVIEERLSDTAKARAEFHQDPERVFSLPELIDATKQSQGVDQGTVYARIIDDHVQEIRDDHLFSAIVLGILALVLAVLVPGGGWVAAAALVANATISTVQAVQAIAEYQRQATEYRLNFLQDEPSLVWVGVAVAAAALDVGLTAAQLLKMSAPALLELETPLREFATAADVETAAGRLELLTSRIDAVNGLRAELREALKARAAAELGLRQALGRTTALHGFAGGADPTPLFEALYYSVRKGVSSITRLRKEKELLAAMGDVTKLSGASLDELTEAFEQVVQVVKTGDARGMDEATVLAHVDRLAAERAGGEGAFQTLLADMRAWRPPTAEQLRAEAGLARAHEELAGLRQTEWELRAELAARRAGKLPGDKDRMAEIAAELEALTGRTERGTATARPALIAEAESRFTSAMRLAEQLRLDPKVLMRSAFNASKERAAVLGAARGVDQVGGLLRTPTGVQCDHIVSLQRMTELEGFGKLRLSERRLLAVRQDNLIAMDTAANLSKGERGWRSWPQAAAHYDAAAIERMAALEAEVLERIRQWIATTVRGR